MRIDSTTDDAALKLAAPQLEGLKKAAQGIESIFMKDLLTAMQKSVKKTQWGESSGSDMYQDLFNQQIAESVSKKGSLGIADMLYRQISPKLIGQARARLMLEADKKSTPKT